MTRAHPLDPLLNPRSVALVGASPRPNTVGNWMLQTFLAGGYEGDLYLVNPRYEELAGQPCFPSLGALPSTPDMAILNVNSARMETLFNEAIDAGVKALTIFDNCRLENEASPTLLERLNSRAREAGIAVCGGNSMGYYHLDQGVHASFYVADHLKPGHITLIAHSGSVFTVLVHNDQRFRFNLAVSAGQEIGATVDVYIDYALELPTTRVIALFIEAIRNPEAFIAALEKAQARNVPVVACKVGRTEKSAKLALTHCGAMAGDDAVYDAIFDRYGVLRARALDEMMATVLLLSQCGCPGPGGLAAVTDSGGLRGQFIDLAEDAGVPFATLSPDVITKLRARLPFALEAVNPLDAAGPIQSGFGDIFRDCLHLMMNNADTAIGAFEFDARDDGAYAESFIDLAKSIPKHFSKPFFIFNSFGAAQNTRLAQDLLEAGVPLLNGAEEALKAVKHALAWREHGTRARSVVEPAVNEATVAKWRKRLLAGPTLTEADGLSLLRDFGIPVVQTQVADSEEALLAAANNIGYPVALKSAHPDLHHKSDAGGVHLGLTDPIALASAYKELCATLGFNVTVQAMAPHGVELAFGFLNDAQFGPIVMVSAGGTLVELLEDKVCALAPFDQAEARRLVDRLRLRPMLDGMRGSPAANVDRLAKALVRFSVLARALSDCLTEVDVNPVIANSDECLAVDSLVITTTSYQQTPPPNST